MITYKPGVYGTPGPAIRAVIALAERIWAQLGSDLTVTSLEDGQHVAGSKHYTGQAVDLRTSSLPSRTAAAVGQLKSALGSQYYIVDEGDHIHVQYNGLEDVVGSPPSLIPDPPKPPAKPVTGGKPQTKPVS